MAWVISWFTLLLAIPGVQITTCTMGSEDAWLVSLMFFTPLAVALIAIIHKSPKHHAKWQLLSAPLIIILPYCAFFAARYLFGSTLYSQHLCTVLTGEIGFNNYPSSWWAPIWAPVQLLLVALYLWVAAPHWRRWFHAHAHRNE